MNKICGKCRKEKDEEEFSWKRREDGLRSSICKICSNKYRLEWYTKKRKPLKIEVGCQRCGVKAGQRCVGLFGKPRKNLHYERNKPATE